HFTVPRGILPFLPLISIGGLSILCLMETASFTSADTIYLKNGKQILCDSAWENGREIRYKINNGTVGIPKALVAKIVKGPGPRQQTSPALNSNPQTQSASNPKPTSSQRVENSPAETTSPAQYTALWGSTVSAQYTMAGMNLIEAKDLPGALEQFQKAYQ